VRLPSPSFIERARALEDAYLESDDPIVQSGFSGGRERWDAERSPLLDAIDGDGEFLDVGCANGLLAADVVEWAQQLGHDIVPYGVDLGRRLVELARDRMPEHADNFVAADAWRWQPDRTWTYVYSLLDLAPDEMRCEWMKRLIQWVEPGGKLILGSYGSRSCGIFPEDVGQAMSDCDLSVEGASHGGDPPMSRFAWAVGP